MDGRGGVIGSGGWIDVDLAQWMVAIGQVRAASQARQGRGIGRASARRCILEIRERSLRIILELVFGRSEGRPKRLIMGKIGPFPMNSGARCEVVVARRSKERPARLQIL